MDFWACTCTTDSIPPPKGKMLSVFFRAAGGMYPHNRSIPPLQGEMLSVSLWAAGGMCPDNGQHCPLWRGQDHREFCARLVFRCKFLLKEHPKNPEIPNCTLQFSKHPRRASHSRASTAFCGARIPASPASILAGIASQHRQPASSPTSPASIASQHPRQHRQPASSPTSSPAKPALSQPRRLTGTRSHEDSHKRPARLEFHLFPLFPLIPEASSSS